MTEPRNETQLTARIVKAVQEKYPEAWVLKTHGNGYQRIGVPDLLVCLRGRLHAFEVKHRKPGETLAHLKTRVSPHQWGEIEKLRGAGAQARVVWEVEQVIDALDGEKTGDTFPA